jgi:hypothetical protein
MTDNTDIQGGPPPKRRERGRAEFSGLVAAALAAKGKWVSQPVKEGSPANDYNKLLITAARALGVEVSKTGGRIYVRIGSHD